MSPTPPSPPPAAPASLFSEDGFTRLVETYQARVFGLCYRLLGEAAEAEEAAQETFLRAYQHRQGFDQRRSLPAWLLTIAAHYCVDRLRQRHFALVGLEAASCLGHAALRAPGPGPEEAVIRAQQARALRAQILRLPPRDRLALVLRYWGQLSYAEIAAATRSTVPAVKSLLHRSRARLSGALNQPPDQFELTSIPAWGALSFAAEKGGQHA